MEDTLELDARDPATPKEDKSEPAKVERRRFSSTAWSFNARTPVLLQELRSLDMDSKVESKETAKKDTPVGLRTRSKIQQNQHSIARTNPKSDGSERPTEYKMDELLRKLIAQTKEQQKEMDAMRSDLKKGMEQQEASIQELREDIAKLHMQFTDKLQEKENMEVQSPISDPTPSVWSKPFGGRDNRNDVPSLVRSKPCIETESTMIKPKAYTVKIASQDTSSDLETSEINSRLSSESDTNETQYEDESQEDMSSYKEDYEQWPSPQECVEYAEENEISSMDGVTMLRKEMADLQNKMEREMVESARLHLDRAEAGGKEISEDMADPDDFTQESRASMGGRGYNQEGEIQTQPEKEFEVATFPRNLRNKAARKIDKALDRGYKATYRKAKDERTAVTLYAGNLDFTAGEQDLGDSLLEHLPSTQPIQVEEIVIPGYKDRHKGYAFIALSWIKGARVDPADICVLFSGRIQVNSRFLYLQELREDVANKNRMKAYHARSGNPTGPSGGYYKEG